MDFFEEQSESSAIKSAIVQKYFSAWARIISRNNSHIGYIDLFSGPGCYDDGTDSTPVLLLKNALRISGIPEKLTVYFNDIDPSNIDRLQQCIRGIPNINRILPRIKFSNRSVDNAIAEELNGMSLIPVFSFIDPFGYAGVTRELITALTKDRGCDCIFFLNYSRINAGINNPIVPHHIEALFGIDIERLRGITNGKNPREREEIILELLSTSFSRINNQKAYVLPFRFLRPPGAHGTRTSHYLIFLSKHPLGYKIMKDIMHSAGKIDDEGIGTFEFAPSKNPQLSLLFRYGLTIDQLKDDLCQNFRGHTLSVMDIFNRHNYGTPFVLSNYKEALCQLEAEKRICCTPAKRRFRNGKPTMADHVEITFI